MDMGVGSFVFSQGIVSAIPLLKNPSHLSAPMLPKLTAVSLKMLPLIFLGILRVILVKRTEYPVRRFKSSMVLDLVTYRNIYPSTEPTGIFLSPWQYCHCSRSSYIHYYHTLAFSV
jgi:hypothetical protein